MKKENSIWDKRLARAIGFAYLIVGIVIIFSSINGITGFAVLENVPTEVEYVLGIVVFAVGILVLVSARQSWWDRYRIGLTVREYESGELSPIQTAMKINEELYPEGIEINGIDYSGGRNLSIRTGNSIIPVKLENEEKAIELSLGVYEIALINDSANIKNCKLQISRQASSKHHTGGLKKIIEDFEGKYKGDLEGARRN